MHLAGGCELVNCLRSHIFEFARKISKALCSAQWVLAGHTGHTGHSDCPEQPIVIVMLNTIPSSIFYGGVKHENRENI